jgi:thiosulfate/3-mercaptopyruvate sulfurtransferase
VSRYVIVGAGAVGASVAAQLHLAGVETLVIARGAHLAALREQGLRYVRPDGETVVRIPVAASPAEVELRDGDVLVLATKTQDTEAAVREWAWQPVKRRDGSTGSATDLPVVTLQNGLENERTALRHFAHVLGAIIWIPSSYLIPGEVVSPGAPIPAVIWLGGYPSGPAEHAEAVAADLRRAGLAVQVVADIARWKAGKLLGNLGNLGNGLDALYPPSDLRAAALTALQDEARTVFAAAGVEAADLRAESTVDLSGFRIEPIPGRERGGSSTWQSLARAGTPETDYLNGEVVLLARLHGTEAPLNAAIQARVHRAAAEATPPGTLDDADLATTLPGIATSPTTTPSPAGTANPAALPRTATSPTTTPSPAGTANPAALPGVAPAPTTASGTADRIGTAEAARTADLAGGAGAVDARAGVLVGAGELYRRLAGPDAPVLLDVRWVLGDSHGARHYRQGHIPGAVYVDLDTELAGPRDPGAGRHPLPEVKALQANARRWGVTRKRGVVVYDDSGGLAAARAWWLLRWAGVPDVRILDGGLGAWAAAGYDQATGEARSRPASDIVLEGGHLPTLTADEAAALPATGLLLDARAGERYRGEVEPIDPRAGHIPGAVSAPTTENLAGGVFRSSAELRGRFEARGTGPVGVYCGSGVTAAHEIAALAIVGIDAALFPGSWSAWSADPDRPVETGRGESREARS